MIDNARLSVLCGGYYHCSPNWNHHRDHPSENFKFNPVYAFFLPASGEALMETTGGKYRLSPGRVYFIPGFHLLSQECAREMSVYWIAFVSESYYLHHRLMGIREIHSWPLDSESWMNRVFRRFGEFFDEPESEIGRVPTDPPAGLAIQIEGVLMGLTGLLIESTEKDFCWEDAAGLERLRPAIDFMDEHYQRNPSLLEISSQAKLTPNYFHRLFKQETGLTPFVYMANRRLDLARKLLFDQKLNISEVAHQAGYDNPQYFSRAFRRRFGLSPSHLRHAPNQPPIK